jgi:hypothetical protein
VMLLMYRSFQTLFARGNEQIGLTPVAAPLSRAAAAR